MPLFMRWLLHYDVGLPVDKQSASASTPTPMRLRQLLGAFVCGVIMATGMACSGSEEITQGTSEDAVRKTLGEPTLVVTERRWIEEYLFKPEIRTACLPKATRLLYYRRVWRPSVTIALDASGRVVCTQRARDLTTH
jgi:hypothetical protein